MAFCEWALSFRIMCACVFMCVCVYVCVYIYTHTHMELGHIFREADKSQDLQSASWRPKS